MKKDNRVPTTFKSSGKLKRKIRSEAKKHGEKISEHIEKQMWLAYELNDGRLAIVRTS